MKTNDSKVEEIQLIPSLVTTKLIDSTDDENLPCDLTSPSPWPHPPQSWRTAAYPEKLQGIHRHQPQPYNEDCTWEVDPGPNCYVWKLPSSLADSSKASKRVSIAHYRWDPPTAAPSSPDAPPPRGAILMLHGLGSHTMFQFLQRAPDGEKSRRGLFYNGSFVQRCHDNLPGLVCYGMDMEGHGYSFDENPETPVMYMQQGIRGVVQDIKRFMEDIRQRHGWDDFSRICLIGHSTGCLALTRAVQELEQEQGKTTNLALGGLISTSPLYGQANVNGSESIGSKYGTNMLLANLASSLLLTMQYTSKYSILTTAYTTEADDARDNSSAHPAVVEKSISPGCFIERWVSGDRDLDPLFHSPYTPIYPAFARSTVQELRAVHKRAPKSLHQCPFLVVHSPYDPVVSYDASSRFVDRVAASDKELFAPPDEYHVLHNPMLEEVGRDVVLDKIIEWIDKRMLP